MRKTKDNAQFSFWGYVLFFVPIAITIGFSLIIYGALESQKINKIGVFVCVTLFVVFVTFVFCLIDILRRKMMVDRPTNQILEATEKIARGDFSVKLIPSHSYYKYDAYDLIMENINLMASELSKNELQKSEFIANFSHEVKTPLSVISSYSQALKKQNLTKEEQEKYLSVLVETSKKLSLLVTNILKLTKLEHQTKPLNEEKLNAGALLQNIIVQYENLIEDKALTLECDIEDEFIMSSELYLEIIFSNLVSNAIKFTGQGGTIKISLKKLAENLEFIVEDNGIGMTKEVGEHIFDKFYQAEGSRSSEGNGLGLSLVKKVIDIMGGEICVESEKDKGSIFKVILKRNM